MPAQYNYRLGLKLRWPISLMPKLLGGRQRVLPKHAYNVLKLFLSLPVETFYVKGLLTLYNYSRLGVEIQCQVSD